MDAFPEVLRSELDWLAAELGAARDAEVLAGSTLVGAAEACTTEMEWQPLTQVAATIAKATRRRVAASGRSVRYSRLMLGLVAWLQSSRWRESRGNSASQVLAAPLDKVATKILARRHKKLLESGKRLKDGTPEERHRVRIAAKKARYATEFFQELHPGGRVKRHIERLTALQDALGWLNDAAVAHGLLGQIGKDHPELAGSADFARGFLRGHTPQEVRELASLWSKLGATKLPG